MYMYVIVFLLTFGLTFLYLSSRSVSACLHSEDHGEADPGQFGGSLEPSRDLGSSLESRERVGYTFEGARTNGELEVVVKDRGSSEEETKDTVTKDPGSSGVRETARRGRFEEGRRGYRNKALDTDREDSRERAPLMAEESEAEPQLPNRRLRPWHTSQNSKNDGIVEVTIGGQKPFGDLSTQQTTVSNPISSAGTKDGGGVRTVRSTDPNESGAVGSLKTDGAVDFGVTVTELIGGVVPETDATSLTSTITQSDSVSSEDVSSDKALGIDGTDGVKLETGVTSEMAKTDTVVARTIRSTDSGSKAEETSGTLGAIIGIGGTVTAGTHEVDGTVAETDGSVSEFNLATLPGVSSEMSDSSSVDDGDVSMEGFTTDKNAWLNVTGAYANTLTSLSTVFVNTGKSYRKCTGITGE
jgi:hypothetical protein